MLRVHGPEGTAERRPGEPIPKAAVWLDLADPTAEEAAAVEAATGLRVPSRAALSEVETSSRLRRLRRGLSLSTPMVTFERSDSELKPLGFLLTRDHLVTVRFHDLRAFDATAKRLAEGEGEVEGQGDGDAEGEGGPRSSGAFVVLLEELVDSLADALEDMASDLDGLSTRIFDFDVRGAERRRLESPPPRRRDLALRRILRAISRRGKVLGKIRASLLGLERIVPFVDAACAGLHLPEDGRFETIRRDIESLDEFETRLAENVQFLLDAALGLIQIEQNNVFRVLTVVSVVGVPPTLIASIYGMNFKVMPELDWTYGYPIALGLILLSAVVPIVYFRVRGWF